MSTEWPVYFKDTLIVGNRQSEIGIATLWTPRQLFVENLDPNDYCVLGQLYSKEGINYMIRNILAYPQIRYVIVCGAELSGSGQNLVSFFEKGVTDDYQVIGEQNAPIHKEIPREAIETVRANVKIERLIGEVKPQIIKEKIAQYKAVQKGLFREPEIFPDPVVTATEDQLPTDQVFKITRAKAVDAWLELLKVILRFGEVRQSFHGNKLKEVFNLATVVTTEDPNNFYLPEWLPVTKEDIEKYLPSFMTADRGTEDYTYGERLWNFNGMNQVDEVIIDYLKRYPTDRAAIAVLFDPMRDHKARSAPCLNLVQATIANDALNLTVYVRSHSIFSGWLLNVFGLRTLQKYIADKLERPIGPLTVLSNCAHIYENEWPQAQDLLKNHGDKLDCTPDPRGYVVITTDEEQKIIKATHFSPVGQIIKVYEEDGKRAKAYMHLYNQLVKDNVISQIPHAFDVGAQIGAAEAALKNDLIFIQDEGTKSRDL
ncbi:MAG: hypothetical protein HY471_01380 [Candidatus Sungbacteria bacterium]|nr:hypothetical protein [Candidatus Sungbacteria bacterium]